MDIMEIIYNKAKVDKQIIAFPEVDEEKILLAARTCADDGICIPLLVGDIAKIKESSEQYGVSLDGMEIFDLSNVQELEQVFENYSAINSEMSIKAIKRKGKSPLYVALMLQATGKADVTFAGMTYTTGDVIWAGQMIVGLEKGTTTVSSIGIAEIPGYDGSEGNLLIIGDSAVCTDPTSDELASIAASACETSQKLLGWEPRCALVSFSTDGSAEHSLVDKVREAVKIAGEKYPQYKIDGEFQLDAAISPEIAAKKVGRKSDVAGRANIIIWPDLNVGNISVKILQQFAGADVYGPILQGFKKVVCDCSRSAPVSELVGNIAISAVRAQGGR